MEAKKRSISMSDLFKVAVYEYLYKPREHYINTHDIPILRMIPREDRTPKGSNTERASFNNVVKELKGFDVKTLVKVPECEKRHIYNIVIPKVPK